MTPRPRLLVVASTFPASAEDGTPAFIRDLAAQEANDFDTLVVVPRVAGSAPREAIGDMAVERFRYFPRHWEDLAAGAIMENLRGRRSRWLQVLPFFIAEAVAIRRAVRLHRPDVLHIHWIIPQGVSVLLSACRVPSLVTTHGADVYGVNDPISRRLKRAVLRRARAVTTMNHDMRRRLIALGAPEEITYVLPMGADVPRFRVDTAVTRQPGRIVFVGRLVEKKGVAVLLTAARELMDLPGWSLHIIGDGPLRPELEHQAEGLPVVFHGAVGRSQLTVEYAASEIMVCPSVAAAASGDQDGLPVALLEGMAAGCAIVASRLPGIDMAVEAGESGLLVPPAEPSALAAALGRVLTDGALRERLGKAAATRAEEFSLEAVGERYRALLHRVAGQVTQ